MRPVFLSALLALATGPAAAGSIETVTTGAAADSGKSIETITCTSCVAQPRKKMTSGYQVPVIEPGTEHREIRQVNGEMKLLRTEAWLGGSPVTYVSKLPPDLFRGTETGTGGSLAAAATTRIDTPLVAAGGIDAATQTASVTGAAATGDEPPAGPDATATSQAFDPDSLELRVK